MKHDALIGRTIAGKFAIEALVGQGAMGVVYKARQIALDTTLAVKVLHPQLAGEATFAARFLREAQAASRVDHPSSMRVIDFGEEPDGLLYIAMEYVDGKTLATILEEEGPLPVERIVDVACQALAALAVAHDIGVVHRDLKPENLMILEGQDDEGRTHDIVKVCDFGVAKLLEGGAFSPSVTAEGAVVGTPEYMSPEQARGEPLDARSDVYAMGVLLFQLMTGKVPFDSATAFGTALMHVNDEPTRPRLLNPKVDSRLEEICLKAMRKRPDDRYVSARELRSALQALIGHGDTARDEPVATGGLLQQIEARPRRTGIVMAGVVVVAAAVVGGLLYRRPTTGAAPAPESMNSATITVGVPSTSSRPMPPEPAHANAAPRVAPAASVAIAVPTAAIRSAEPTRAAKATNGVASAAATPPPAASARGYVASKTNARRVVVPSASAKTRSVGAPIVLGTDAPSLPSPKANADAGAKASSDAKVVTGETTPALGSSQKSDAKTPMPAGVRSPKVPMSGPPDPADMPLPIFPDPPADPTPPAP